MDILNKAMEIVLDTIFLLIKAETNWKRIKKYGGKLKTLLDQQIITQIILMKGTLELCCKLTVTRFLQVFIDDCFYKLAG